MQKISDKEKAGRYDALQMAFEITTETIRIGSWKQKKDIQASMR